MTAASSICRIRLSCSTTASTSNWKALGIAVLLRLGDTPDRSLLRSYRVSTNWQTCERVGAADRRDHQRQPRFTRLWLVMEVLNGRALPALHTRDRDRQGPDGGRRLEQPGPAAGCFGLYRG